MRLTSPVEGGDTGRIELYNDLRRESAGSSYLLAYSKNTETLVLAVNPGNVFIDSVFVEFAGGDSPEFPAPTSLDRIDLLTINAQGVLERIAGFEDDPAQAPTISLGLRFAIAQIYNRSTQVELLNEDDITEQEGFIQKDLRKFFNLPTPPITRVFISSGTWNKPLGLKYVVVEVQGGGGGGAGVSATGSEHKGGAGGGAGGYSRKIIKNTDLGSTETVTVGGGGAGGSAGNNSGVSGNTSSFGSHCSASGGSGGEQGDTSNGDGGVGGSGSGGDLNIDGGGGGGYSQANNRKVAGGHGGSSFFGAGARARSNAAGVNGGAYGGGWFWPLRA